MTSLGVPEIAAGWALFLDLDGTLLDIAPRPDAVIVPPALPDTLAALRDRLDGALAVVTGRARETVDALLAPFSPAGGFGHGAELRDAEGRTSGAETMPPMPPEWPERLARFASDRPGLLLERKPHGLAMHFRAAPHHEAAARKALEALLEGHADRFALLPAHMAFEVRPRLATKSRALAALMETTPFRGRMPVVVGDDVTDEDAMEEARRQGGMGLHVGRDFTGGPAEVRAWLACGLARLPRKLAHA